MNGALPQTGFLRLSQIIGDPGDPQSSPPKPATPPIIPISKSAWWAGVKSGKYPASIKLGRRLTVWRAEDIRALIDRLGAGCGER